MTSTNDGKDVKSNQTSGPKGKSHFIELYKSLDAKLNADGDIPTRAANLSAAWRHVHSLCAHSAPSTHPHLLAWIQRHTARTVLQSSWQAPENRSHNDVLDAAIKGFITETQEVVISRGSTTHPWESHLLERAVWFREAITNPWDHPVLKVLLQGDSKDAPSDEEILEWLKQERGITFVARLRQLVLSKCDDLALSLASAVMSRVRAGTAVVPDVMQIEDIREKPPESCCQLEQALRTEAGFTQDVWDYMIDIELVLLHKRDKNAQCISLAKSTPLRLGHGLVERLATRIELTPKDKKIWKNAKDVAIIVAQVIIGRCMLCPLCEGVARAALYWCARAVARLTARATLPKVACALAAPAATARHLFTFAVANHVQLADCEDRRGFVCELFVRALTAGMNEVEKLKLDSTPEKEREARQTEQTIATWFVQLGTLLADSARLKCECALTAFSVHPSAAMYEKVKQSPPLPKLESPQDSENQSQPDSGARSWANDSRKQTNFVKTSETLNVKDTQELAYNVLSTAIFTEGERLTLSPELCQDLAVLLSVPRVKTLSWDMDREKLLANCRTYMERTAGGTRVLTTELRYLNLDPRTLQHLPEEEDGEDDLYYGIEKGYEHLVEFEPHPEEIWQDAYSNPEKSDSAASDSDDLDYVTAAKGKKKVKSRSTSENDSDPLSLVAESKRLHKKKERPHSKERSKEKKKGKSKEKQKDTNEPKKERKPRKKKEKTITSDSPKLAKFLGVKVGGFEEEFKNSLKLATIFEGPVTDSDYDSQGKSSFHSEGTEPDVLRDGSFPCDELIKSLEENAQMPSPKTDPLNPEVITEDKPHSTSEDKALTYVKDTIAKLIQHRKKKTEETKNVSRPLSQEPNLASLLGTKIVKNEKQPEPTHVNEWNHEVSSIIKNTPAVKATVSSKAHNKDISKNHTSIIPKTLQKSVGSIPTQSAYSNTHQNSYQRFLMELQKRKALTIERSKNETEPTMKKVSCPRPKGIPILPKTKPSTSQSAKPVGVKKENAPNTFARRNHMHQANKRDSEYQKSLDTSVSRELDQIVSQTERKMKLLKAHQNLSISQVVKQTERPKESPRVEVQLVEQPTPAADLGLRHPVLSDMLEGSVVKVARNPAYVNQEPIVNQSRIETFVNEAQTKIANQARIEMFVNEAQKEVANQARNETFVHDVQKKIANQARVETFVNEVQKTIANQARNPFVNEKPKQIVNQTINQGFSNEAPKSIAEQANIARMSPKYTALSAKDQDDVLRLLEQRNRLQPKLEMSTQTNPKNTNVINNFPKNYVGQVHKTQNTFLILPTHGQNVSKVNTIPQETVIKTANMAQNPKINKSKHVQTNKKKDIDSQSVPNTQVKTSQIDLKIPIITSQDASIIASHVYQSVVAAATLTNQMIDDMNYNDQSPKNRNGDINATNSYFNSEIAAYNDMIGISPSNDQISLKNSYSNSHVTAHVPNIENQGNLPYTFVPTKYLDPNQMAVKNPGDCQTAVINSNPQPSLDYSQTSVIQMKSPATAISPTANQQNIKSTTQNWTSVLDTLRKLKNPSRAPTAIDLVLQRDTSPGQGSSSNTLRQLRIVKSNSTSTSVDSVLSVNKAESGSDLNAISTKTVETQKPSASDASPLLKNVIDAKTTQAKTKTPRTPKVKETPPKKDLELKMTTMYLKKENDLEVKKPTIQYSKKDPVITGISHSEYAMLGELFDDELLQEIDESPIQVTRQNELKIENVSRDYVYEPKSLNPNQISRNETKQYTLKDLKEWNNAQISKKTSLLNDISKQSEAPTKAKQKLCILSNITISPGTLSPGIKDVLTKHLSKNIPVKLTDAVIHKSPQQPPKISQNIQLVNSRKKVDACADQRPTVMGNQNQSAKPKIETMSLNPKTQIVTPASAIVITAPQNRQNLRFPYKSAPRFAFEEIISSGTVSPNAASITAPTVESNDVTYTRYPTEIRKTAISTNTMPKIVVHSTTFKTEVTTTVTNDCKVQSISEKASKLPPKNDPNLQNKVTLNKSPKIQTENSSDSVSEVTTKASTEIKPNPQLNVLESPILNFNLKKTNSKQDNVSENLPNIKINNLNAVKTDEVSKEKQDRLRRKRLSIINRQIQHGSSYPPIELSYLPIIVKEITQNAVKQTNSSSLISEEVCEEKCTAIENNDDQIPMRTTVQSSPQSDLYIPAQARSLQNYESNCLDVIKSSVPQKIIATTVEVAKETSINPIEKIAEIPSDKDKVNQYMKAVKKLKTTKTVKKDTVKKSKAKANVSETDELIPTRVSKRLRSKKIKKAEQNRVASEQLKSLKAANTVSRVNAEPIPPVVNDIVAKDNDNPISSNTESIEFQIPNERVSIDSTGSIPEDTSKSVDEKTNGSSSMKDLVKDEHKLKEIETGIDKVDKCTKLVTDMETIIDVITETTMEPLVDQKLLEQLRTPTDTVPNDVDPSTQKTIVSTKPKDAVYDSPCAKTSPRTKSDRKEYLDTILYEKINTDNFQEKPSNAENLSLPSNLGPGTSGQKDGKDTNNRVMVSEVIELESDSETDTEAAKKGCQRAKKAKEAQLVDKIPTMYKNSIKFVEMHGQHLEDNQRKIRIIMPNRKVYLAMITGTVEKNFDALFRFPEIRKVLMSGFDGKKYFKISALDPKNTQQRRQYGIDTVNLISDDEEESTSSLSIENTTKEMLYFSTEFGKYRVLNSEMGTHEKHQLKFSQKCMLKLPKCDESICPANNSDVDPKQLLRSELITELLSSETDPEVIDLNETDSDSDCVPVDERKVNIVDVKHMLMKNLQTILKEDQEKNKLIEPSVDDSSDEVVCISVSAATQKSKETKIHEEALSQTIKSKDTYINEKTLCLENSCIPVNESSKKTTLEDGNIRGDATYGSLNSAKTNIQEDLLSEEMMMKDADKQENALRQDPNIKEESDIKPEVDTSIVTQSDTNIQEKCDVKIMIYDDIKTDDLKKKEINEDSFVYDSYAAPESPNLLQCSSLPIINELVNGNKSPGIDLHRIVSGLLDDHETSKKIIDFHNIDKHLKSTDNAIVSYDIHPVTMFCDTEWFASKRQSHQLALRKYEDRRFETPTPALNTKADDSTDCEDTDEEILTEERNKKPQNVLSLITIMSQYFADNPIVYGLKSIASNSLEDQMLSSPSLKRKSSANLGNKLNKISRRKAPAAVKITDGCNMSDADNKGAEKDSDQKRAEVVETVLNLESNPVPLKASEQVIDEITVPETVPVEKESTTNLILNTLRHRSASNFTNTDSVDLLENVLTIREEATETSVCHPNLFNVIPDNENVCTNISDKSNEYAPNEQLKSDKVVMSIHTEPSDHIITEEKYTGDDISENNNTHNGETIKDSVHCKNSCVYNYTNHTETDKYFKKFLEDQTNTCEGPEADVVFQDTKNENNEFNINETETNQSPLFHVSHDSVDIDKSVDCKNSGNEDKLCEEETKQVQKLSGNQKVFDKESKNVSVFQDAENDSFECQNCENDSNVNEIQPKMGIKSEPEILGDIIFEIIDPVVSNQNPEDSQENSRPPEHTNSLVTVLKTETSFENVCSAEKENGPSSRTDSIILHVIKDNHDYLESIISSKSSVPETCKEEVSSAAEEELITNTNNDVDDKGETDLVFEKSIQNCDYEDTLEKNTTHICKTEPEVLRAIELEDPKLGTYIFPLANSSDCTELLNESSVNIHNIDIGANVEIIECENLNDFDDFQLTKPNFSKVYSNNNRKRKLVEAYSIRKRTRRSSKSLESSDSETKYKQAKRIDAKKSIATSIDEISFNTEYEHHINYMSTVGFSYSLCYGWEHIDPSRLLVKWPITKCEHKPLDEDAHIELFTDDNDKPYEPEILNQTLAQEISAKYDRKTTKTEPATEAAKTNSIMGFCEGSGRVIQDFGAISKFSAATLSDVKQYQPVLSSKSSNGSNHSTFICSTDCEQVRVQRFIRNLQLRRKIQRFFDNSAKELSTELSTQKAKDHEALLNEDSIFPFHLYTSENLFPSSVEAIVQVVQVGQPPVSTAAQNPMTCDPRVTHVSDASPSQCSVDNSSPNDNEPERKSEYTELTTANLSMPIIGQEYAENSMPPKQNAVPTCETITIQSSLIKSELRIELEEENPEETEFDTHSNDEIYFKENETHSKSDYSFERIKTKSPSQSNSTMQQLFSSPQSEQEPDKQMNGTPDKTDQIAHAMNAAGITSDDDNNTENKTPGLVDLLNRNMCQTKVSTSQSLTNSYSKTSSVNTMSLQQALAQILPPPLNHSTENNLGPQLLHIVQSKNPTGNITLVDNAQQSVINSPNATSVLHIVQNKPANGCSSSNGVPSQPQNTFSGLSLVEAGLQQGGNQLLHIVNTGNQKNPSAGHLLKRVNLLTNLTNVQGGNEQKMLQFVCKSADGKSIQLNAPHQRGMVLRLQPIETPNVQTQPQKPVEIRDEGVTGTINNSLSDKDAASLQEIKSRSVYEENYAKFIQNTGKSGTEKSTSLPKFNQAFGKPVFQEGNEKGSEMNTNDVVLPPVNSESENTECQNSENSVNLEHITSINNPPLLLRKSPAQVSQSQPNLAQQIKQTIAPMNIQTMHGGVIYTRQIPVNIGGGQTINLISVPTTELVDDSGQKHNEVKFVNQADIEPSIIKIVPQTQAPPNAEVSTENGNVTLQNDGQGPQPQQVLTQMRIKLPMLSKNPQMIAGARVVRPSFFQIQRNVIGGANQPVYQQLVLTAAPPLGQQTIRLPQTEVRPTKAPESPNETQMSSSTLEQLREFDMVLEQVKERSTVQPNGNPSNNYISTDSNDSPVSTSTAPTEVTPVLYSIGGNQPLSVAYVNRKSTVTTSSPSNFVRLPDSSGIADSSSSSSSSTQNQVSQKVTTESAQTTQNESTSTPPRPPRLATKPKSKSKQLSSTAHLKVNTITAPKPSSTQKPLEDEQTTQKILYILAEYKEQMENSPDKDKPAPRRRSNPPSNPGSSRRKKNRRSGAREVSPVQGDDACRTMGSEDSSCGTSQGDCTENCLDSSPQGSPRKIARKLTFEQDAPSPNIRPQPARNLILADGQTITVARGTTGKPATALIMPANYLLPVSMVKGGQQIAIVTNQGPKLLTVTGGESPAANALLLQRLIGPAGLKPVLARPGIRHVRLPTAALQKIQAFNLAATAAASGTPASEPSQPPDSTDSPAPEPPPEQAEPQTSSPPWADRESEAAKPSRAPSPEDSEPWNIPSSADPHDYTYEETVRSDNLDRTVLEAIPDRYSPDMETRMFDKMFDVESKKSFVDSHNHSPRCGYDIDASDCEDKTYQVVQKKDISAARQHRLAHVSAAALRHKYAILEHELRLQKSLSEECEDLGVDSPSASDLFPEAELLFSGSPAAQDHGHDHRDHDQHTHHEHTPQQTILNETLHSNIDEQIATEQLLPRQARPEIDVNLGLEDVGIVTVSEDGMQANITLDQEEFARSHPNTTFHSEPTDDIEVQPFTLTGLKSRHITSAIFHPSRTATTVLMTAPQTSVIAQNDSVDPVKYSNMEMMHIPPHNLNSVLVKDDGLTRFDSILTDTRELHLSNTASAIVHSGHATQVIRRVCYEDNKRERERFLIDEPESLIAGKDAKMIAEDSRDATLDSLPGVDDGNSSPERHDLFWESNSASASESRRPLDFSSDSEKCCKSPLYEETNSTDSSGVGTHMRLDSVIKEARGIERSCSAGSSVDDIHPPLRTYPPKRSYHNEGVDRSVSGKTRAGEGHHSADNFEVRRRASNRGVVKRGCHCCNGSPVPSKPKRPRQKKSHSDFTGNH